MLLAAVDDRLAAAAVSCGNTENVACADFNPPGSTDDGEQNPVGGGPVGFDRWDLLYPLAPKPLLVLASDKDFFGTYSPNYINSETRRIEEEPDSKMEEEARIFVAPTGSVVKSFGGETPFSMNRKRVVAKTPAPLGRLLALDEPPKTPAVTVSRASYRTTRIEVVEFAAAPSV